MSITVIKEGAQEGKVPTGPRTVTPGPVHRGKHVRSLLPAPPLQLPSDSISARTSAPPERTTFYHFSGQDSDLLTVFIIKE